VLEMGHTKDDRRRRRRTKVMEGRGH